MIRILSICLCALIAIPVFAASSPPYVSDRIEARLITAEAGVAGDTRTLSAALEIKLAPGWKTYWKSPGQVGFPPEITWDGSYNVANGDIQWPAPHRFDAFDIENYGYKDAVTYPVLITLTDAGQPADLTANVSLLVCSDLCVPEDFSLTLSLFQDEGVDADTAPLVADAIATLPRAPQDHGVTLQSATITPDATAITATFQADAPFMDPQLFPDLGLEAAFGAPDIILSDAGRTAQITLPVLGIPKTRPQLDLVLTDSGANGPIAVAFQPDLTEATLSQDKPSQNLIWIIGLALLGGLILNVMPCVLPVLAIKLTSALKSTTQSPARIRAGFLTSAFGVMTFMWALAAILIALRAAGTQIGWGIQFQNPVFLGLMLTLVALFAANLLGLFEITLPQNLNTKLANADGSPGLLGDFATGAFAAVLATPCSAPFLGTAVAFALAGSGIDTLLIFTALGAGLALPYLAVAAKPGLIQKLPKPGKWMVVVKWIMGTLLAATALWLASVLLSVAGPSVTALTLCILSLALVATLRSGKIAAALAVISVAVPLVLQPAPAPVQARTDHWTAFDEPQIADLVAANQTVFVDVTADWCLTCKTNKALVLDIDNIKTRLKGKNVTAMQGDWTRPDPAILSFLKSHDRFGIPFNVVYGPGAPQGIALPEILTPNAVIQALEDAKG